MKDNMEVPKAALDSQPPHWIVGRGSLGCGGKDRRSGRFAMRWIAMWGSTPHTPGTKVITN